MMKLDMRIGYLIFMELGKSSPKTLGDISVLFFNNSIDLFGMYMRR
jgi:hypothetical protein